MLHIITGASASGKSNYAEQLACKNDDAKKYYIATMFPYHLDEDGNHHIDEEVEARIRKHRKMRNNRGFETIECYTNIESLQHLENRVVLLECMSNLLANERYLPEGRIKFAGRSGFEELNRFVTEPIVRLSKKCRELYIVTNEIFSEVNRYDDETQYFEALLGTCNQNLAKEAETITEVICGIPVMLKDNRE